jgi:hypothetical protein
MTVIHKILPIPLAFRVISVSASELVIEIDYGTEQEIQKYKKLQ